MKLLNKSFISKRIAVKLETIPNSEHKGPVIDINIRKESRVKLFSNISNLYHVPEEVVLVSHNEELAKKVHDSKITINELALSNQKKSRLIAFLILSLIVLGVVLVLK